MTANRRTIIDRLVAEGAASQQRREALVDQVSTAEINLETARDAYLRELDQFDEGVRIQRVKLETSLNNTVKQRDRELAQAFSELEQFDRADLGTNGDELAVTPSAASVSSDLAEPAPAKEAAPAPVVTPSPEATVDTSPLAADKVKPIDATQVIPVVSESAVPTSSTTVITRKSWWNVSDWSGLQKLFAVVGLIVGLFFGINSADWATGGHIDNEDLLLLFSILWVLFVSLFGFFLFGWIFGFILEKHTPHSEVVTETTTTTTELAPASSS